MELGKAYDRVNKDALWRVWSLYAVGGILSGAVPKVLFWQQNISQSME